jgi:hypothetical protein
MTRSSVLRTFLIADFQVSGCQMPFACAVCAYDQYDALDLVAATYSHGRELARPGCIEELTPEEIQRRIGNFDRSALRPAVGGM